jgi:hypothetical protein
MYNIIYLKGTHNSPSISFRKNGLTGRSVMQRFRVRSDVGSRHGTSVRDRGLDGSDLPLEKWTPDYADFASACSGVI